MSIIGDDIWFAGYKIGSLAVLPASTAEDLRQLIGRRQRRSGDVYVPMRGNRRPAGHF